MDQKETEVSCCLSTMAARAFGSDGAAILSIFKVLKCPLGKSSCLRFHFSPSSGVLDVAEGRGQVSAPHRLLGRVRRSRKKGPGRNFEESR